tara:strand:+ start:93 stop:443 length:351 start_codon:yes stop_codon:yes gene_type:complete
MGDRLEAKIMKISKQQLRKIIAEELTHLREKDPDIMGAEAETSAAMTKRMRSTDTAKEIGTLSRRERQVLGALKNIQTVMAAPGDQVTSQVIVLVKRLIGTLEKSAGDAAGQKTEG